MTPSRSSREWSSSLRRCASSRSRPLGRTPRSPLAWWTLGMAADVLAPDVIELPFEVPRDWDTARLSSRCEFVRDGDWIETKDQGGNDYRLLQISNIGVGRFVETGNFRWITH